MKVYTRLVIDIATGNVLSEDSFEYTGPVVKALGGGSKMSSFSRSGPAYIFPELRGGIVNAARKTILDPAAGMGLSDLLMQQATNRIRGSYGARGLEGSGIAIQGEQNAINELALKAQQQQATNVTNLLAAGSGTKSFSTSSGGGGGLFGK